MKSPLDSTNTTAASSIGQPCRHCGAARIAAPRQSGPPFVEAELEDGETLAVALVVANAIVGVLSFVWMPQPEAIGSVVGLIVVQLIAAFVLRRRSSHTTSYAVQSSPLPAVDTGRSRPTPIIGSVVPLESPSPSEPSASRGISSTPPRKPIAEPREAVTLQSMVTAGVMPASLDVMQLERRRRETVEAQELLASWAQATPSSSTQSNPATLSALIESICDKLDEDYRPFARQILSRATWTKDEFTALARSCYVMASDGLDRINSAALEQTGEPWLIETENQITVNSTGLSE